MPLAALGTPFLLAPQRGDALGLGAALVVLQRGDLHVRNHLRGVRRDRHRQRRGEQHLLAGHDAGDDADETVVVQPDLDRPDLGARGRLDPDGGQLVHPRHALDRHVDGAGVLFDDDFRLAVHAGLEHVATAVDLDVRHVDFQVGVRPHPLGVGQQRDLGDLAHEDAAGHGVDAHAHRQPGIDLLQVALMDVDLGVERLGRRQVDELLALANLLPLRQRLLIAPAVVRARGVDDEPLHRRQDARLGDLLVDLAEALPLAGEFQFAGP